MLVLTRKRHEEIVIAASIRLRVLEVNGRQVRLGIEAPESVRIVRAELPPIAPPNQPAPLRPTG